MKINNELTMTNKKDFIKKHVSEWMADDGNNRLLWKNKAPTVNEVLDFLAEALAEDRSRVRGNLPEIRVSALSLLLNDCANCGQVINRSFVDDLTCRIQDEYKQKILSSLDEPFAERTNL